MLFVHGRQLAWEGETLLAVGTLEEVGSDFRWVDDARLIAGRSLEQGGRVREALDTYRSVDSGPRAAEARQLEARLLRGQGDIEGAVAALMQVEPSSVFAGAAAAGQVQLWLLLGDLDRASEQARLAMGYARTDGRLSGAELAQLEIDVATCRVGRARRGLKRFERRWGRAEGALDALAVVGDPTGLAVWEGWFGPDPVQWDLPPSVVTRLERDGLDKSFLRNHLGQVAEERVLIDGVSDETFAAIVAPHLRLVVLDGERRLQALMGAAHQSHLRDVASDLKGQLALVDVLGRALDGCEAP